jgi:L-threonylcarbamoyladenylate synthase
MTPKIIDVKTPDALEAGLAQAAEIILSGGIVALPTESFYGLAVNAMDEGAIRRLLAAKKIRDSHPILLLLSGPEAVERLVREIPPPALRLMDRFWPGGLTLVLEAGEHISPLLTAGTGKIGVRLSSHPIAAGLARKVGLPITGTSANVTGEPPCTSAEEVLQAVSESVEAILDGGTTEGGKGSTVLDVTVDPPKILREGMVGRDRLRPFLPGI